MKWNNIIKLNSALSHLVPENTQYSVSDFNFLIKMV